MTIETTWSPIHVLILLDVEFLDELLEQVDWLLLLFLLFPLLFLLLDGFLDQFVFLLDLCLLLSSIG